MYKLNPAGMTPFNPLTMPTVFSDGRVFVPTGKPHFEKGSSLISNPHKKIDLSDYVQILIGRDVSFPTRKYKKEVPSQDIRRLFKKLRSEQIGKKEVGVTFIDQSGYYEGKPENSMQIMVLFFPSKKERTFKEFKDNIFTISEIFLDAFGQKVIYLKFYRNDKPYRAYKVY